jgi:hypothetical protein
MNIQECMERAAAAARRLWPHTSVSWSIQSKDYSDAAAAYEALAAAASAEGPGYARCAAWAAARAEVCRRGERGDDVAAQDFALRRAEEP